MKPTRIAALVIGCLLIIPSLAMLLGGSALGLAYAFGRGGDGYFDVTLDRLETDTVAITAEDITFAAEPGSPDWIIDALDADVRLRVTNADSTTDVFVGIARRADVDAYLTGIAHDEVADLTNGLEAVYRTRSGRNEIAPPTSQTFWTESASGPGSQELVWEATSGRWSVVVMNADGSPRFGADVNVGVKAPFVLPLALIMIGLGAVMTTAAIVLIVAGAHTTSSDSPTAPASQPPATATGAPTTEDPVALEATLDPGLSRWLWLVKWFLAIPHFIVLAVLGIAFAVLTLIAAVAIVFTGRYPKGMFEFNVGVLRWSWRVTHYATTGGIGTDRYPSFSLQPEPGDAARLEIAYPERLSRGLVFVKWLLAIPHLVIVALLVGSSVHWLALEGDRLGFDPTGGGGLLGFLVLAAGIMLLFTGEYPRALFDLIVGFNRWIYRVIAYVALMTDRYPPFRLDQGGTEPAPTEPSPPVAPEPAPPVAPAALGLQATPDADEGRPIS